MNVYYKYTSSYVTKIILTTSKLRWSSPLIFNDFNEFQQYPTFSPTIEESWSILLNDICNFVYENKSLDISLTSILNILIKSIQLLKESGKSKEYILSQFLKSSITSDDVEKYLRENMEIDTLNVYRILCLTKEYDNAVMWSHYSDNHFGCVLAFKPIKELDSPFLEARQVDYIQGDRIIGSGLDVILNTNMKEIIKKIIQSICFTKTSSWSYEKEWRIMTKRPNSIQNYDDFIFYPEELESITFGVKTTQEDKDEIREIIRSKYPDIIIYQMKNENGKLIRQQEII